MRPSTEEILQHPLIAASEAHSHPVACCPLKTGNCSNSKIFANASPALEYSEQQILHLRQQITFLEDQLAASKKVFHSPNLRAIPAEPFPVPSDLLNKMQL